MRFPRGRRCHRAWHVWREAAGTCEVSSVPGCGVRVCGWCADARAESRKRVYAETCNPVLTRVSLSNRKKDG